MKHCTHPDCEHTRYVPTEGDSEFCATRNALIRKAERLENRPVKEKKPLKRTPIAKVSDKRAVQLTRYNARVKAWKEGKFCKICEDNGDTGVPCDDNHHMRGKENDLLEIEKWWLPVCRACHNFITENSRWALENGYSLPRTTSQEQSPTI